MEILDKIKYIKKNRLSPHERYLYKIISNLVLVEQILYDDRIYYNYPNIGGTFISFYIDTKELRFHHTTWEYIETMYGVNYNTVQSSIKKIFKYIYNMDNNPIKCVFY